MSTVINHYHVNYLASHLQLWYIRESLARRSPTAELVLWNFPLHELQKGTWTRTERFLWCYYGARYPWHRQSTFPAWSRSGATHTMEDAALTIPLVIKLWYWGRGKKKCWNIPSSQAETGPFTFSICLLHVFLSPREVVLSDGRWGVGAIAHRSSFAVTLSQLIFHTHCQDQTCQTNVICNRLKNVCV